MTVPADRVLTHRACEHCSRGRKGCAAVSEAVSWGGGPALSRYALPVIQGPQGTGQEGRSGKGGAVMEAELAERLEDRPPLALRLQEVATS